MIFRYLNYLAPVLFACLLPELSSAEDLVEIPVIKRMQGEFVFDGMPDEASWLVTEPFPMVTHLPVFGNDPEERTEIRMLFDDEYIYVGASLYTRDPSKIMNTSRKRDEEKLDCDWVAVVLDSYNDNETGLSFWTTPAGLRTDATIFNDGQRAERIDPLNTSWNTHWDVKSQINGEGWFSEIRIPVSSLKFQEHDGEVVMGLIIFRMIPEHDATYIYPPIPNEYGEWSFLKVSKAQKVVFPGLKSRKPLYITPYAAAGISQANELNDAQTDYEFSRDSKFNAGLDVKYGITSNLTMDLTVNTDFAQVEADDEMTNLTRFDLFFEEKRQFFLERASVFDFNSGGSSSMFYSRRIGLDDDGNIVPILGGARLIGRKNGWDMGFLNMQTMKSDSLPSENFGVLRLRRRILNENSYAGGIYTSRLGMDGSYNHVYGFDGLIRLVGDDYMKLVWGQSFETGMANKPLSLDNSRFHLGWERRKDAGFTYNAFVSGAGADYNPGIGFQHREDYISCGGWMNYYWFNPEPSPILKHGPMLVLWDYFSLSKGIRESTTLGFFWRMTLKNNWFFGAGPKYEYDFAFENFKLSDDAWIPAGEYGYLMWHADVTTPLNKKIAVLVLSKFGQFYDGSFVTMTAEPHWSVSSSLQFSGTYQFDQVELPVRNQRFISHIVRLKTELMFTKSLSLSAFIQYNSAAGNLGSNIRFRYNPREGNDLWLVLNEGTNTDLRREIPHRPVFSGRTLMLKYNYTFRL